MRQCGVAPSTRLFNKNARIDATFTFRDGKIARHTDRFDLRAWAAQALGLKGKLLGWLPSVQNAIRANADKGLRAYIAKKPRG